MSALRSRWFFRRHCQSANRVTYRKTRIGGVGGRDVLLVTFDLPYRHSYRTFQVVWPDTDHNRTRLEQLIKGAVSDRHT